MASTAVAWAWLFVLCVFKAICWIFVASSVVTIGLIILFAAYRMSCRHALPRLTRQD